MTFVIMINLIPSLFTGNRLVSGYEETVYAKELKMRFKALMDTGAMYCALFAINIKEKRIHNRLNVSFETLNEQGRKIRVVIPVSRIVYVRSSMGHIQRRYAVVLNIRLIGNFFPVLVTLSDRTLMRHPLLIGRNFLSRGYIVDASRKYVLSRPVPVRRQ